MERFWTKVEKTENCWEWRAYRQPQGYGTFRLNGTMALAHRVAYELLVGPIPDGLELDHLCRNKGCVNPSHLEPVTRDENRRRSPLAPERKGFCPQGHPYDGDNTRLWQKDGRKFRVCVTCVREQARDGYARRRNPAFLEKERRRVAAYRARLVRTESY